MFAEVVFVGEAFVTSRTLVWPGSSMFVHVSFVLVANRKPLSTDEAAEGEISGVLLYVVSQSLFGGEHLSTYVT